MNWPRTYHHSCTHFAPETLPQLVAIVQRAERSGGNLKAVGSGWSYSGAAVDDSVNRIVVTSALNGIPSSPHADPNRLNHGLIPYALRDSIRTDAARRPRMVHVEAGITIHDLNHALDPLFALPTMGGANGQTLAGAVSTGVHGSDVDLPPIADMVRAIHLVGPGGQEWWLEPAGALAVTDEARMHAARDAGALCSDIRIVYDDDLFRAALVSLGRFGLIYSFVIEVVEPFNLEEFRHASTWAEQEAWIRANIAGATAYSGPRFVEIVVNPYANQEVRDCVVTHRRVTSEPPTNEMPGPDLFNMICSVQDLRPQLQTLADLLIPITIAAGAAAGAAVVWIPLFGPFLAPVATGLATAGLIALQAALRQLLDRGRNLGEALAELGNLAARAGQGWLIREMIGLMIQAQRPLRSGPVIQKNYRMLTAQGEPGTTRPEDPVCIREVDGLEFCLDLSPGSERLFRFMNDVFALAEDLMRANRPVGLALSLRFMRRTAALLGMQQFERNCTVEFFLVRGMDANAEFLRRLYPIAELHNAIPHWGLIHDLDARKVHAHYGANHLIWQRGLARILEGGGRAETFRTRFSVDRDLEPPAGCLLPQAITDLILRALLALGQWRRG